MIFLEAIRQMRLELPHDDTCLVQVTPIFYSKAVGELKSKPTQHSVKALQAAGLQPDFLVCRSEIALNEAIKRKISLFSNVHPEYVISAPDISSIYQIPLVFEEQNLGNLLGERLKLTPKLVEFSPVNNFSEWKKTAQRFLTKYEKSVIIALPGKYMENNDSYVSINEALKHGCAHQQVNLILRFVDTEKDFESNLLECDGILLTPGFGSRGVEGMIHSAELAIEHKIPYLGICFGAQLFYVAFMRKIMKLKNANSTEINPKTPHPVICMMNEQQKAIMMGGSMRLGGYEIKITEGTKLFEAYGGTTIRERFRHRFHINLDFYTKEAKEKGMRISALDPTGKIVNAIELEGEHFMVGTQFHPEYTSRPYAPSPIYRAFIKAVIEKKYK
jgi:CTP synthase